MSIEIIVWFQRKLATLFWINRRDRYHAVQILIHWLIVGIVIEQYWTSKAILRVHSAARLLGRDGPYDMVQHNVHLWVGLAMIGLVALRIGLRLWLGTPQWTPDTPVWRRNLALAIQLGLYGVLLGQAVSGAITSYFWWPMNTVHSGFFYALLVLLAFHVAGALLSLITAPRATVRRIVGI